MTEPVDHFDQDVQDRKAHELDVLLSKHHDYGPRNIADSPGGALNGLRVRLHDKLARVNHLIDSGADPHHEGLIDTALDIANYGTIMGLVLSGQWPGVEVEDTEAPAPDPSEAAHRTMTPWWIREEAQSKAPAISVEAQDAAIRRANDVMGRPGVPFLGSTPR